MQDEVLFAIEEAIRALNHLKAPSSLLFIKRTISKLVTLYRGENKLILAGNGGSLCDAAHFGEELVGFFRQKRRALPAIVLSEAGYLTCVANDVGFDQVFSRGIEALGQKGDLFIGLTTSGNSPNMVEAFKSAKKRGLDTIAFLGKTGGALKGVADLEWIVPGTTSDRIQEAHMTAIHLIIEQMERELFGDS